MPPQGDVLPPVHDRVEVEVESRPAGQSVGWAGPVRSLQLRHLAAMLQAVGVGGQGGGLGQGGQPREQRCARIGGEVVDVGDPPGLGELQRQPGDQVGDGGYPGGGWIPCGPHQLAQVQGEQVGDRRQQTGPLGLRAGWQLAEVDELSPGPDLPAHSSPDSLRVTPQPGQPFGCHDRGDPGAVEGDALGRQGGKRSRPRSGSQGVAPGPGHLLGWRDLGARPAGEEEVRRPRPEVGHRRKQRGSGVAEPGSHLGDQPALREVAPECHAPALGGIGGVEEESTARPGRGLGVYRNWSGPTADHVSSSGARWPGAEPEV